MCASRSGSSIATTSSPISRRHWTPPARDLRHGPGYASCNEGEEAMSGADAFLAARDLLLRHATDYRRAYGEFRWPVLDRFNWALDHFDRLPSDATALWLVGAEEERLSFGALRARSNQVA